MSPTTSTFLFQAINFAVLALVLGKVFFRPVRQALRDRRAAIEAEIQKAAAERQEIERLRADLNRERQTLATELDERRRQAAVAAQKQAETIIAAARAAAGRQHEALAAELRGQREALAAELAREAGAVAGQAVARLLVTINGPELEAALVQAACQQFATLDVTNVTWARIESEHELSTPLREALVRALGSSGPKPDFRLVPDLGPGVRIASDRGLIDATAAGLAGYVQTRLAVDLGGGNT